MRHPARTGVAARIADETQSTQDAVTVKQHRQDDRVAGDARAAAAERHRIVDRLADIFALVVEAHIDFVQAVLLGAALAVLRPVEELLARRPAIAAAGELAPAVDTH